MKHYKESYYNEFKNQIESSGRDLLALEAKIGDLKIETPSWGYGNAGTRFKVFTDPASARNVYERVDDAALIHELCGAAPSIALHIPWDSTDDWSGLQQYAANKNLKLGAINPNLFQDEDYKLGSVCHPNPAIRQKATDHLLECCQIMTKTESNLLSVWLADGTNYSGQDDIRNRKHRMLDCLQTAYKALPPDGLMLLEYKFFEPAFCHTDIADWGTSLALCRRLGKRAKTLVDTGHHPQGTNIAYVVAQLLDEECLGGFHFNARQYADDDLIVGSNNSWDIFVIFTELIQAKELASDVAFMIDQSHNIEPKLEAMLQSVLNCQSAYAKALLVDYDELHSTQSQGDVLGAHRILKDAFETDVRPWLAHWRLERGLQTDPVTHLRQSGEVEKRVRSRRD